MRGKVRLIVPYFTIFMILVVAACGTDGEPAPVNQEGTLVVANLLVLESPAFTNGEAIPEKHTCDGADVAPPLTWREVPTDVVSYALIMDDPDAPGDTWVHWVVYNIPANIRELPTESGDSIGIQGTNSWNRTGYGGPCPPQGEHRYFFKLYALDSRLELEPDADKETVLNAMEGHILAQGQLMGTYSRS